MFEAVYVTCTFGTAVTGTDLDKIGYSTSVDLIETYE
jgi:hypothetical protein